MGKLDFGNGFSFADQSATSVYGQQTQQILNALNKVMGVYGAFVTDETCLFDFMPSNDDLSVLSKELGIPLKGDELFQDLVVRLFVQQNKAN